MATFVLVHGAWLGGWVWSRVAPDLRSRGHTVYTPTLTGLGEREHLLASDIDLELHATDILNLLDYEGLDRAILVGHGYGGAVVQRVAAVAPERIGRLVFLDPLLARDGLSLHTTLGAEADTLRARAYDDDGVAVYAPDTGLLLDGLAGRDADWVEDRLAPMPVAPYDQALDLAAFFTLDRPILAVRPSRGDRLAAIGLAIAAECGEPIHEILGGHLVMITKPEPTAELLDNFARQPSTSATTRGEASPPD
jgi:pimeloyl-ACP methyl ester carboxylesterase